jgi:hypothetical protein
MSAYTIRRETIKTIKRVGAAVERERLQAFLMHVGHPGHVDIPYTVTKRRTVTEVLDTLSVDAPERAFFEGNLEFLHAFPDGQFHCWGIPPRAKPAFEDTNAGDLILFAPWIGIHDGGIHQLGIVKAKCPEAASQASRILWPNTPYDRQYPWLLFFDTEVGRRDWYDFLDDLGYAERWNPRGWYRRLSDDHFKRFESVEKYLDFLRVEGEFHRI